MLRNIIHKLGYYLLKPFREHFIFMIVFFILVTFLLPAYEIVYNQLYINAIILSIHCFVLSFIVTLVIGLIKPKILRQIIQGFLLSVLGVLFAISFYCIFVLGYLFDSDVAQLILGTDINEAKEFASVMIPKWAIFTISFFFLFLAVLWYLSTNYNLNLGKLPSKIALGITCLCILVNIDCWTIWQDGPINVIKQFLYYQVPDDLYSHYTHPNITFSDEQQGVNNIILIIGESFARSHSSLYGYDKMTNPYLDNLRDSSMLFVFDSIDSPAPSTALSLKYMLSLYNKDDSIANKQWFDYTSIIELMQCCGYDCFWFGNQAKGSRHNSASRLFAEACQHQEFLQQEGGDKFNTNFDMILVDSSFNYVSHLNPEQKHFIIYHMMGSHFDFCMRYPQEFSKFSEIEYADSPQEHRSILASYDNSILYNDYIVSLIMDLYKNKDAIIIYLPDHGQVMYRDPNEPDFFAHASEKDPKQYALGVEIPFMIYASPLYQERHPDVMERIRYRQNHTKVWNSENLPYLIMDLIGVKEVDGIAVKPKSLLN